MRKLLARLDRTTLLTLAGLGCLDAAAWWSWGLGAGLAATGASLIVVEVLSNDTPAGDS